MGCDLGGNDALFEAKAKDNLEILKKQVGSSVTLEYVPQSADVNTVLSVK